MNKNTKIFLTVITSALVMISCFFTGCSDSNSGKTDGGDKGPSHTSTNPPSVIPLDIGINFTHTDNDASYNESSSVKITLADGTSQVNGAGAAVSGDTVTIENSGTYIISGKLSDGRLEVRASKSAKVHIVFCGVDISNSSTSPFYVESADKVVVTLADGSVNSFSDSPSYKPNEKDGAEPNACIYSREDITFNGKGSLTVKASYNNGIGSSDDIKIVSGTFDIEAVKNGIKGKDSVSIKDGSITVKAKDGIKSDNTVDAATAIRYIIGGNINIEASDDALQAENRIEIAGGTFKVSASGKNVNCGGTVNIADGTLS